MRTLGLRAQAAFVAFAMIGSCAQRVPATPAAGLSQAKSILVSSTPANGSIVSAPVTAIELRFDPPAKLGELTVIGGDGMKMPMMVTAIGEVSYYSVPLPELGPGVYTVGWKATVGGALHHGKYRFTVR